MLRLLLDEHISPKVAAGLAARQPDLLVLSLARWEQGRFLGLPDDAVLTAAQEQGLTLVTYDLRTIVPLLKEWGEQGRPHGGVIFVDGPTLAPNDFGGLSRALGELDGSHGDEAWQNRVVFLRRSAP